MKFRKKFPTNVIWTDSAIMERIKNGDEKALEFVYKKSFRIVAHMIIKNGGTNEDSKDFCQNAVLIFWQKARSGDLMLTSKITTYVYAVARNLWLKEIDRKKKFSFIEKDSGEFMDVHKNEREKIIADCLSQLDEKCRKILMYHYYDEMSAQQIADKLKLANSNSAKTQKYKCQQKLISLLKAQYSESDFF